jgi:hypothetical protein
MDIGSLSPSRAKTSDDCSFKYYMSYTLNISDQLSNSPFASNFGKTVHNVLEEYAKSHGTLNYQQLLLDEINKEGLRPYDGMTTASKRVKAKFFVEKACYECPFFDKEKQYCNIVSQHIDKFEGCPRSLHEDAIKMTQSAIRRYDKYFKTGVKSDANPNGKIIGVEEEFEFVVGKDKWGADIIMHGLMDLVIEEDKETIIVVDYKTGFKTQTTEELIDDMQARMYSIGAKMQFPQYKFVLLTFDYFRGVPVDIAFSKEQDEVTLDVVRRKWNDIKGTYKIKRRPYDWYCQYLCKRSVCDVEWAKLIAANKKNIK